MFFILNYLKCFLVKYGILEILYLCLLKLKEYKYIELKMYNLFILCLL